MPTGRWTTPSTRAGDGAAGWSGGAPYDRVIATYAVEEVPWAWVEQTRPGGRIVAPGDASAMSPSLSPLTGGRRRGGCRGWGCSCPPPAPIRGRRSTASATGSPSGRGGPSPAHWRLWWVRRAGICCSRCGCCCPRRAPPPKPARQAR
ncbi:protein-L-isoaspartate O-methyltransferase [Streptomyces desertarenae]|uniref:Protein-L-isoaspartate O-methyltransferase n=1 Tax=Streptomyces desertarenae TaxID=2666184 RepID=A0ABW4PLW4_9ACTN